MSLHNDEPITITVTGIVLISPEEDYKLSLKGKFTEDKRILIGEEDLMEQW